MSGGRGSDEVAHALRSVRVTLAIAAAMAFLLVALLLLLERTGASPVRPLERISTGQAATGGGTPTALDPGGNHPPTTQNCNGNGGGGNGTGQGGGNGNGKHCPSGA